MKWNDEIYRKLEDGEKEAERKPRTAEEMAQEALVFRALFPNNQPGSHFSGEAGQLLLSPPSSSSSSSAEGEGDLVEHTIKTLL